VPSNCNKQGLTRFAGKTTTTELTVLNSGPETTNPHDASRTPGGSSCGSAAAVADYHVPFSLGTQTGGSVIRPASYTGVFAFKPTHNAVSSTGTTAFSPSFDTLGFFARSVEDLQLVAEVFGFEEDSRPIPSDLSEATIALIRPPKWHEAGPGTVAAMARTRSALEAIGVTVKDIDLPSDLGDDQSMIRTLQVVSNSEARVSFLAEYRTNKSRLDPQIQDIVKNALHITRTEKLQAIDKLSRVRSIVDELFARYTIVIAPSAVDEAPLGLTDMGSPVFNTIWTVSGRVLVPTSTDFYRLCMCQQCRYQHLSVTMVCPWVCPFLQADHVIDISCESALSSVGP
jgi:Asp-tRNA(Asn)/Glu-tRNA(Gln) amidotransferase A subunit family amidase